MVEAASEYNVPGRIHTRALLGWAPLGGRVAVYVQMEVRSEGSAAADVLVQSNPVAEVGLQSPGGPWLRKGPPQYASG